MEKMHKKKIRYIQKMPKISQFSPRGKPGRPDEIELRIDEYEAIKLADYQGYDQSEGAINMGISRPSFGRILRLGRKKVADALVNGKTIKIRIGGIQVGVKRKDVINKREIPDKYINIEKAVRDNIIKYGKKATKLHKVVH